MNRPENTIPWDQLIAVLSTEGTPADQALLQEWLQADPGNQELLDRLKKIWQADYPELDIYLNLDEKKAWADFAPKLLENQQPEIPVPISSIPITRKWYATRTVWMSIAASFLLLISVVIWYSTNSKDEIVATIHNEQKAVKLPDGSKIRLESNSLISISGTYNQEKRVITDVKGSVFFEIEHIAERPFIIDLGNITITDLGTSFSISRNADSIRIQVFTGKVAFTDKQSSQSREIPAGMYLNYQAATSHLPAQIQIDSLPASKNHLPLDFDNLPLAEVIHRLQLAFGESIVITDPSLLNMKLTAKLEGQTFEQAVIIICNSLGLKSELQHGNYFLSRR